MPVLAAILGCGVLALVLVDAFNTIVLARRTRHMFRIARAFYTITWDPFAAIGRRIRSPRAREGFLSIYGPLSLLLLFALWTAGLVAAFGLLQWALDMKPATLEDTLGNDFYLSATTLFTLGTGDPKSSISKLIAAFEGGIGLGFLGLVVGYLPVLYQSFSQRELRISMLDARAGSPPSAGALLQFCPDSPDRLEHQLMLWEEWTTQLLEAQVSFPMLAYFRSQHANQSWLTALVAVMDWAAVVSLCSRGNLKRQADLTFAIGRHALSDVVVIFGLEKPLNRGAERSGVDHAKLAEILAANASLFDANLFSGTKLAKLRKLYEPQAIVLGNYFLMSLPAWIPDSSSLENWKVDLMEKDDVPFAVSDPFSRSSDAPK